MVSALGSIACSEGPEASGAKTYLGRDIPSLLFPEQPSGWGGTGGNQGTGGGGTGGWSGTGAAGGNTSGSPTWIDPDPPPSGFGSVYCGDWARDAETEECDSGPDGPFVACTANCQTLDFLLLESQQSPVGQPNRKAVRLGTSPHQLAVIPRGFAVAFAYPDEQKVAVRLFDERGTRGTQLTLGEAVTFADPAITSIGSSLYVAWNQLNGDGSELGVALRRVDTATEEADAQAYANATTFGAQSEPDVAAVGSTVAVAWTDTSDPKNGPDVKLRRFDARLSPLGDEVLLGDTPLPEGSVALASHGEKLAAVWRENQPNGWEVIVVWVDGERWRVNVEGRGPPQERPSLVFLDDAHVLVTYALNAEPENTGVSNVPRLWATVVELGSSTSPAPFRIEPLQPDYVGQDAVGQRAPRLVAGSGHIYLAWQSDAHVGDPRGEELWLKRLYWDSGTKELWLGVAEESLPRSQAHRHGDQREVALVTTPLPPLGALLMGWTDFGTTVDPDQGHPDVVLQLAPLPLRRGDAAEKDCTVACEAGEGPCSLEASPSECVLGTTCVMGRGPWYGYGPRTPVCVPNHCLNGVEDASETETGVDCGGECGPCFSCYRDSAGAPELSQLGTSGFCSAVCRCESTEGDCNSDTDCVSGLECMQNVGDQHIPQYPPEIDLCVSPSCVSEGIILCGVPGCSSCPAGHIDYCQHQTCGEGEGDCDGDEQCGPGLYCATGTGGLYGAPGGVDVCRPLACASNALQPNTSGYCTTECRCGTGTGVCTSDAQCLEGSVCSAKGLSYGRYPELAVCTPEHCTNGVRDGDERRVDCGGSCGDCSLCETNEAFASFEDPERPWGWAANFAPSAQVSMAQSGTATHGSASLEVTACGWADLMSGGHSTADLGVVGNELWLDLFIPGTVPNAAYVGRLSLSVSVPGAGIEDWRLEALTTNGLAADHALTALPRGSWSKLRFQVPEVVQAAYHQDWESARFRIGLSTAPCASGMEPSFLLDHLRFGGAEAAFRSIYNQPNVTPTSLAENFSFEQLEVWRDAFGGPSALTPEREHVAHLIQAARVPHNQTVVIRSGHFTAGDIGASNRLRLDVRLPSPASGSVTGSITATGACHGVAPVNLGTQTLSGRPLDAYSTLAFTVPSSFQSVLAGTYSQCSITLSITSAGLDEPLSIDNLRFGAPAFCEDNQLSDVAPFALNQPVAPNGTETYPYPLCTAAQFQTLVNTTSLWNKHFTLETDIDLSTLVGTIGTTATPFTGSLEGRNHELQNYSVDAPETDEVGLFGRRSGGTIQNLRLRGFRVRGRSYVGALAGYGGGTSKNVHVLGGSVIGVGERVGGLFGTGVAEHCSSSATVVGQRAVGGLIGYMGSVGDLRGSSSSGNVLSATGQAGGLLGEGSGPLTDCFATGNVVGGGAQIGGLVGAFSYSATVTRSHSTGPVVGNADVGGLVGLLNGTINDSFSTSAVEAGSRAGGLVGTMSSLAGLTAFVSDSFATGSVTTSQSRAGGLVGQATRGRIERCFATGSVNASAEGGGLLGYATTSTRVADAFASGSASVTGAAVGGLAGRLLTASTVTRSYALGTVAGASQRGGLVGRADNDVSVSASVFDSSSDPSLLAVGTNNVQGVSDAGRTALELRDEATFVGRGWNFVRIWKMSERGPGLSTIGFCNDVEQLSGAPFQVPGALPVPDGSSSNPYRICTAEQMQTLSDTPSLWGKSFVLEADINLSGVAGVIGNDVAPFTGTFDGHAHRLGAFVRTGTTNVGLFGRVLGDGVIDGTHDGVIRDLRLDRVHVRGITNVGGLVGALDTGVVQDVVAIAGTVAPSSEVAGIEAIGGIVGYALNSQILRSVSIVTVSAGSGVKVGGLVGASVGGEIRGGRTFNAVLRADAGAQALGGVAGTASTISESSGVTTFNLTGGATSVKYVGGLVGVALDSVFGSSSSSTVSAPNATHVGGLVGWSTANVENCSATGAVSGSQAGGLIGLQEGQSVVRSSATGAVTAGSTGIAGALVGDAAGASISDSYASGSVSMSAAPSGGGLIGRADGTSVERSYARGAVTGTHAALGGFIGTTQGAALSFSSSYYSSTAAPGLADIGQDLNGTGTNPAAISAVSDTALKTQSTFTGWDFVNVWNITSGNYPVLR